MSTSNGLRLALLLAVMAPRPTAAQAVGWQSLEVRQNIDVKNYVAQPAVFQVVVPTDSDVDATLVTNAGAIMTAYGSARTTLGLTAEYSRNTAIDKAQNTLRGGLLFDWKPGGDVFVPIILLSGLLKRDQVKEVSSVQAAVSLTATGDNGGFRPNTTVVLKPGHLTFSYAPYLGLEFERTLNDSVLTFWRGTARLDAVLRLGEPSKPVIELQSANAVREDLGARSSPDGTLTSFHSVSLTAYPFYQGERFVAGVSAAYIWGEDPTKGFASQSYFQFGLAIRLKPI